MLREESLRGGGPVLAVVCGGTNVGKSTVFNALVGEALSAASPLARGTKRPVLCGPEGAAETLGRDGSLGGYRTVPWRDAADALAAPGSPGEILVRWRDGSGLAEIGLLDSPDMDSAYEPNRRVAEDLLFLADACLFVTTPEKYNDEVGVRFLAHAARLRKAVVVVVNKSDEPEVLADVRDRVVPAAAPGAPARIVPVPPLPAEARAGGKWADGVRKELRAAATDGARRAAAAGALECFRQDFREVLRAAAAQAAALRELREAARAAARTEAAAYRREIEGGRFFELERVYREVLAELRVPLVDDLYAGVGRFWRGVRALLPGAPPGDALQRKVAERRAVERDAAKTAARRAADVVERIPARFADRLGDAARACVPPTPAPESLSRDLDRFLDEQEKVADAWVATRRRETL
ncbi:MAG: GTPase domain-containing protein, partial [Planctomycetales bacterium]|nr:GTPase domain-containing protein [Planctomycetales bacterium]